MVALIQHNMAERSLNVNRNLGLSVSCFVISIIMLHGGVIPANDENGERVTVLRNVSRLFFPKIDKKLQKY